MNQTINVRVVQSKRWPVVLLSLSGFDNLAEAKGSLLKHLWVAGVSGDGGEVESVTAGKIGVGVDTDLCGFSFTDEGIEKAMAMNGAEHVC